MTTYRVSELAERVGLPPSTLRFYEQAGLVPARRSESGYRLFDDRAVARVEVITTGKRLGLTLEDIRDLLRVWEDGLCRDVRERLRPMVLDQITDAERRAAEIHAFVERLRQALTVLDGPAPAGPCGPGCGIGHNDGTARADVDVTRADVDAEPPIACTLTGGEQADRLEAWRRLLSRADAHERIDGEVVFRFPAALAGEIGELAAAELECCPFFEFTLRLAAGQLRFEVRAPEDAEPLLATMFG